MKILEEFILGNKFNQLYFLLENETQKINLTLRIENINPS